MVCYRLPPYDEVKYRSPEAFRPALLHRLKQESKAQGVPLLKIQMRFLFERFLLRAQVVFPQVTVKGGAAMEFRLPRARMTRDLDLSIIRSASNQLLPRLQSAAQADFGDFISFVIEEDPDHAILEADGMKYQGRRLRAQAQLADKPLFGFFGLDLAVGEPANPPETMTVNPLLASAGFAPLELSLYALESHIAEKLHAYTLPRPYPNSRVKDLPDLALLATYGPIERQQLRLALETTFQHRSTHALPDHVMEAPPEWSIPYSKMALENSLPWPDIPSLTTSVKGFLDPILGSTESRPTLWDPQAWSWT